MKRILSTLLLAGAFAAAIAGVGAWKWMAHFRGAPYGSPDEKVVDVPPGSSRRAVVRLLARAQVLSDERAGWLYVRWLRRDARPFKAGQYAFSGALRPDEVLDRIARGEVKLYRFTVPEGLRIEEIAEIVERSGLAKAEDLARLARDPAVASALDVPFPTLEGFLFPDTYAFAWGVTPQRILEAMVRRFREVLAEAEAKRQPTVLLSEREVVTLASIVEKETGQPQERPRIACVFQNRLRLGMRLQTDPTVMYATFLRTGRWSKNISRTDLLAPHPYNTYATAGLPPGPIANPGAAAVAAVLSPSECKDLYFVSRNDGTHVFCPDLKCHNAAVHEWQVEFFRRRR
ncbi:MAG TPA: endolytic transglycosylase MltG [Anaeromyxobacteraceae bacterium]|nr:endolytic transglycosylase MltG [Anaeromyxobacteraceae bacterium]